MTQWQHLFMHGHTNRRNLFEMVEWCRQRHGDPILLPEWIERRLQCSAHVSSWDQTLGGWTRDWRDSGYSFYHSNLNFWPRIQQVPHTFPSDYLENFPLCILFYNREELAEFCLIWG